MLVQSSKMKQSFSHDDRRAKLTYQEVLTRIPGVTIPVFGQSWNPPTSERKTIQRLLAFLQDRQVLYDPLDLELFAWASDAILGIRNELTKTLQKLPAASNAISHVKIMRLACTGYLDQIQYRSEPDKLPWVSYFTWLGELRGIFGLQIAQLSVLYGIDLEGELIKIVPVPDGS